MVTEKEKGPETILIVEMIRKFVKFFVFYYVEMVLLSKKLPMRRKLC